MNGNRSDVYAWMKSMLNQKAVEEGKKILYKDIFKSSYCWPYIEKSATLREYAENTVIADQIPAYCSLDFTIEYFKDLLKKDFEAYMKEHGDAADE